MKYTNLVYIYLNVNKNLKVKVTNKKKGMKRKEKWGKYIKLKNLFS